MSYVESTELCPECGTVLYEEFDENDVEILECYNCGHWEFI